MEINERLRLIAAEESLDGTPSPTPDGMRRVLDLLRRRFNYVVMDLPVPASLAEMQALRAARHLLVVMAPISPASATPIACASWLQGSVPVIRP